MFSYLYALYTNAFQSDCAFFSDGTYDRNDESCVGVEGRGNTATLTLMNPGGSKNWVAAQLTVKRRSELLTMTQGVDPSHIREQSLFSNWKIITTPNNTTVVYSESEPVGFVFENKEGFPFDIIKGAETQLTKLKYFDELAFIDEMKKHDYDHHILAEAKTTQSEKFQKLRNNLSSGRVALNVVSLERILGVGNDTIEVPPLKIERCYRDSGGGSGGVTINGDRVWTGQYKTELGVTTMSLTSGRESARGQFEVLENKNMTVQWNSSQLRSLPNTQLLHKWYVEIAGSDRSPFQVYYLCPELKEGLLFTGDRNFPYMFVDSLKVNHQYFLEKELNDFMSQQGLPIAQALKIPGWTEKKLQAAALDLSNLKTWVSKGTSFEEMARLDENKFFHLLKYFIHVESALQFVSIQDIVGVRKNQTLSMKSALTF